MKVILIFFFFSFLYLQAQTVSLGDFLESVKSSEGAKALETQSVSKISTAKNEVLSGGFILNAQTGYASTRYDNRNAHESHVTVEKNILLGDSDAYLKALNLSLTEVNALELNRLKALIFEHYINACSYKEKISLLMDAKERESELASLIKEGVEGGEFDQSSLLQSELAVEELQLSIDALESNYNDVLSGLYAYTQNNSGEPLCKDLPYEIAIEEDIQEHSTLFTQMQSEITAAAALNKFRSGSVQDITLGAGYDNEMDVTRSIVFLRIPLSSGDSLDNERESARLEQINARQQLLFMQRKTQMQIQAYKTAQKMRNATLERLNNVLILKAYQTTVLLKEQFMGSEGSYLEYIDSEKTLFNLLIRSVDTVTESLLAKAKLYYMLGIDPQKDF